MRERNKDSAAMSLESVLSTTDVDESAKASALSSFVSTRSPQSYVEEVNVLVATTDVNIPCENGNIVLKRRKC